jgi:hypothetical protein
MLKVIFSQKNVESDEFCWALTWTWWANKATLLIQHIKAM